LPFVRRGRKISVGSHHQHLLLDMSDKRNWKFLLKLHELGHIIVTYFDYDAKKEILKDLYLSVTIHGETYWTSQFKKKELKEFIDFLKANEIDLIYI